MKRSRLVLAALLGVFACGPAMAQSPSWNYASATLLLGGEIEAGSADRDMSGYQLELVRSWDQLLFFRGSARVYEADLGPDIDMSANQLSIGARFPLLTGLDLWASANYERLSYAGVVGTGLGVDAGISARINQLQLEFAWKLASDVDFDGDDAEYTGYTISAAFEIAPKTDVLVSVGDYTLDFDNGGEVDFTSLISVGARFRF